MRRPSMLAAILAGLAVLTAASSASAMYHPTVGRWAERDPIGYAGGNSLYEFVGSGPGNAVDPSGLAAQGEAVVVECCCLEVAVEYNPAGPQWEAYPYAGGWRVGFTIIAKFKIKGDYKKCTFAQNETGSITWNGPKRPIGRPGEQGRYGGATQGGPNTINAAALSKKGDWYVHKDPLGANYPSDGYGQMTVSLNAFTAELKCTGTDKIVQSKKVEITGSVTANRTATDGSQPTLNNGHLTAK